MLVRCLRFGLVSLLLASSLPANSQAQEAGCWEFWGKADLGQGPISRATGPELWSGDLRGSTGVGCDRVRLGGVGSWSERGLGAGVQGSLILWKPKVLGLLPLDVSLLGEALWSSNRDLWGGGLLVGVAGLFDIGVTVHAVSDERFGVRVSLGKSLWSVKQTAPMPTSCATDSASEDDPDLASLFEEACAFMAGRVGFPDEASIPSGLRTLLTQSHASPADLNSAFLLAMAVSDDQGRWADLLGELIGAETDVESRNGPFDGMSRDALGATARGLVAGFGRSIERGGAG